MEKIGKREKEKRSLNFKKGDEKVVQGGKNFFPFYMKNRTRAKKEVV